MMDRRGFSEVELLVALTIFTVGVLGGVALMGAGYRYQGQSRLETEMTIVAERKVEEFQALAGTTRPDTVALLPGGDTESNVEDYFDTVDVGDWIFLRRWRIEPGPANTRRVTVTVKPFSPPAEGSAKLSTTLLHD